MNRNPSYRAGPQRPAGHTSSEALSFGRAILGESSAPRAIGVANGGIDWEQLEFLASISTEHERKLRDLARAGQVDAREREQLGWLAEISTEHERQFQDLLREEAAAAEVRQRARRCLENLERFRETGDEDKHPRLGGPPNAGWFAATGGSSANSQKPSGAPPRSDSLAHPRREHAAIAQAQQPGPPACTGRPAVAPAGKRAAS